MSWITDVLLLAGTEEIWGIEDDEGNEIEPETNPFEEINRWLQSQGVAVGLVDLSHHAFRAGNKAMQALVYGGAFNFLDEDGFLKVVRQQRWLSPHNVQLLMKSEMEERFTMYEINREEAVSDPVEE